MTSRSPPTCHLYRPTLARAGAGIPMAEHDLLAELGIG